MAPDKSNTPDQSPQEQNRRAWNAATPAHNSHKLDQATFLRDGGSTLFPEEIGLLGDLKGKNLAHLQCNCGQDSLSLSRRGADVTGIDISDSAISFANKLSQESKIPATFHRSDLYDWLETTEATFNIAYASYGAIPWLNDLSRWARGVKRILKPQGRLVLLEFHPLSWSYSSEGKLKEPYFIETPIHEREGVSDYVGEALSPSGFAKGIEDFKNPETATCYQHTTADIVNAIAQAGLRIDQLIEYPYTNGCKIFEGMECLPNNRYGMPSGSPAMPLMLGLCAQRV